MRLFGQLSLMVFMGLGLTGCVQISGEDTFNKDGSFVSMASADMSAILELEVSLSELEEGGEQEDTESPLESFCRGASDEAYSTEDYEIESFDCYDKGEGVFEVKILGQASSEYFSAKDGVYTLTIDATDLEMNDVSGGAEPMEASSPEELAEGIAMMEAMGMTMEQVFVMPAPVTHSDIGIIEGNKVVIGLEDFVEIGAMSESGEKVEFKIIAGGQSERNSIRHQSVQEESKLQEYHRNYLTPQIQKKRSTVSFNPNAIKKSNEKSLSSRLTSLRNQRSSRQRMPGDVRREPAKDDSKVEKTYYHPFLNQPGRHYRGSYRR